MTKSMTQGRATAFTLACLAWMFVGLPVVACALGWVLR